MGSECGRPFWATLETYSLIVFGSWLIESSDGGDNSKTPVTLNTHICTTVSAPKSLAGSPR